MDIQALTQYFLQYGAVFIFVIVLLEYLNLPGFPAGVIMPLAGIWAAKGQIGLGMALLLALVAGMLGSWILYGLGRLGGGGPAGRQAQTDCHSQKNRDDLFH